jgi:uncharacterized membrane protein YcaP (DUF421 family)
VILGTWLGANLIGKKSLAQVTPYDLVILMIISNVVAQPLLTKDSFKTVVGTLILALSIFIAGKLSLNSKFYRMDYSPDVVIANGQIIKATLKKNRLNIYTLFSMLRVQGYTKLSDVNYAILEAGGELSVIPKASARPLTPQDMNLKLPEEGLTYPVIIDGTILKDILRKANVTEKWLTDQLSNTFKTNPEKVLYAEIDSNKQLFINLYQ